MNGSAPETTVGWQRDRVRIVGEILLASEEPDEGPALQRDMVADRSSQNRIGSLQRIQDRAERRRTLDVQDHFAIDLRERAQVRGQHDANHGSVWTSTERTGGKSRTTDVQLSPPSAEQYT